MKLAHLSLETAKELYKQGGASKQFALDNYSEEELIKKELPKSWKELEYIKGYFIHSTSGEIINYTPNSPKNTNKDVFPTKEYAEAALALAQLLQLYEVWKGKNDYDSINGLTFSISRTTKNTIVAYCTVKNRVFQFSEFSKAKEFLTTFKDLFEIAKPLL